MVRVHWWSLVKVHSRGFIHLKIKYSMEDIKIHGYQYMCLYEQYLPNGQLIRISDMFSYNISTILFLQFGSLKKMNMRRMFLETNPII